MENLHGIFAFIKEVENFKNVTRTAWTSAGKQESTAEHSWRLAVMTLLFAEHYPKVDMLKVIKMCLIHDLGELYEGDVSAKLVHDEHKKILTEKKAMERLLENLSDYSKKELLSLWCEYNQCSTEEAKLVKALDKAETIIQHNQGLNPKDFDYEFNLNYGKKYFEEDETLKAFREAIDEETREKLL